MSQVRKMFLSAKVRWAVSSALALALVWLAVSAFPEILPGHTTRLMGFLRGTGYFSKTFLENGLPVSNIPRISKSVTNPFYVVHYGILYSGSRVGGHPGEPLWQGDDTIGIWDSPPPPHLITFDHAMVACDWVAEHIENRGRGYHLYYDFEWPYPGTTQGFLATPWYSGLTDGYALVLLLRGYAETGRPVYSEAARRLYDTLRLPIEQGGSLVWRDGKNPWIEEYVAPNNRRPPLVFNGMFYATLGVLAYERTHPQQDPLGPRLLASLATYAGSYERNGWTCYDSYGRPNSFKYHRIHIGIATQLYRMTGDPYFRVCAERWAGFRGNYFYLEFIQGTPSVNSWGVLLQCLVLAALLAFLIQKCFQRLVPDVS